MGQSNSKTLLSSVYILCVSGSQVVKLSRQRFFEDTVSRVFILISDMFLTPRPG